MKSIRTTILSAALVLLPFIAAGQTRDLPADFGSWVSVQATKSLGKGFVAVRAEHRSFEKMSATECWFLMADGGYKITPWLTADVSYEFWQIAGKPYHKAIGCVTGTLRQGNLSAALREKYEFCFSTHSASNSTLRSRLKVQYSIPESRFRPYISAEVFNWDCWKRSLYYVGTDIVVSKHSSFDIFYLYHIQAAGPSVNLIGLGYNLSL